MRGSELRGATGSPRAPGQTPTGGRRLAWGAWARGVGSGIDQRLCLKETGLEGCSALSAARFPLPLLGGYRLFPTVAGAERGAACTSHPPPSEPRPSPAHGRGPPAACAPARRSLHDHTRAGEGRPGTEETRSLSGCSSAPNRIPLRFTPAPRPRTSLTRVGLDVLPQEVAAGQMLEAKVLGDPLAHGALARARRPEDDRAQEFGSHCLLEEWGSHTGTGTAASEKPRELCLFCLCC